MNLAYVFRDLSVLVEELPRRFIVGDREVEEGTVAVRTREGEDLGSMAVADFAEHLARRVGRRGRTGN